jgi:hypothetical protein
MQLMVRAWKQGIDLSMVTVERLQKTDDWTKLPHASPLSGPSVGSELAAPPKAGKFVDLGKVLDDIVTRVAGPGRPVSEETRPPCRKECRRRCQWRPSRRRGRERSKPPQLRRLRAR